MNQSYGAISQDWGSQLWINPDQAMLARGTPRVYQGAYPGIGGAYPGIGGAYPGLGSYAGKSAAESCAKAQGLLEKWRAKRTRKPGSWSTRPSEAKKARKIAEHSAEVELYCSMARAETRALEAESNILTEAAQPASLVVPTQTSSGGMGTAVLALLGLGAVGVAAYFLLR